MLRFRAILISLTFCAMAFSNAAVHAQGKDRSADIPLDALQANPSIEFHGLVDSRTIDVQLPYSWLPQGDGWLDLPMRASDLLDPDRSSLSITINGKSAKSLKLPFSDGGSNRVSFPGGLLRPGGNQIAFVSMLYLKSDKDTNCANWEDPARWLTVDPGGSLHVPFASREFPVDLANLAPLLVEPMERYAASDGAKPPLVVLPSSVQRDDLSAVVALAYGLGHQTESSTAWSPQVISIDQFRESDASDRNIVFVNELADTMKGIGQTGKNFLAVVPSPWDSYHVAVAINDVNRQDGFTPTAALADPARVIQLHGSVAYLDNAAPTAPPVLKDEVTFEELGYPDRTVRGVGQLDLNYRVNVPYDTTPVISSLVLNLAHAPNIDAENSVILVFLNGVNVASIVPNSKEGTGEPAHIDLPPSHFQTGQNFIRISFRLRLPHSSCDRSIDSIWATVFNSSKLQFSQRHTAPTASLRYFPAPFSDYRGFTFVVPDGNSWHELGNMADLAFALGAASEAPGLPPGIVSGDAFDPAHESRANLIVVGLPTQNSAIAKINSLLPQPFQPGENQPAQGYGVYLPNSSTNASLGVAQIVPSPWARDGVVLVVSGNDQQALQWTWDKIRDSAQWPGFDGNLLLVGSAGRSSELEQAGPASFEQTADASPIPIVGPLLQSFGNTAPVPGIMAGGLALGVALLVVAGVYRFRNKEVRPRSEGDEQEVNDEGL